MSKMHFEWAAAYVRALHNACAADAGRIENAYVALFNRFGPRFDEPRFRAACQVRA